VESGAHRPGNGQRYLRRVEVWVCKKWMDGWMRFMDGLGGHHYGATSYEHTHTHTHTRALFHARYLSLPQIAGLQSGRERKKESEGGEKSVVDVWREYSALTRPGTQYVILQALYN